MTLTMAGRIDRCALFAFRMRAGRVRHLVPEELELVTHDGWAFWNVVVCHVDRMRPAGLPPWTGLSYHHAAYRLHVRARGGDGRVIEGLYFVRSDADGLLIGRMGNLVTDFRFHRARIRLDANDDRMTIDVHPRGGAGARMAIDARSMDEPVLAPDSCFHTTDEAAHFLTYRPIGLSADPHRRRVRLAEVIRDETQWVETPLRVERGRWSFFDQFGEGTAHLERATRVAPVDYRWRLGHAVPMAPREWPMPGQTAHLQSDA